MVNRRTPWVHARFMIFAAIPSIDPIGARILYNLFAIEFPLSEVLTYCLMDAILLWLIY